MQWDHVGDLIETVGQSDLGRGGHPFESTTRWWFQTFSPKKPGEDVQV